MALLYMECHETLRTRPRVQHQRNPSVLYPNLATDGVPVILRPATGCVKPPTPWDAVSNHASSIRFRPARRGCLRPTGANGTTSRPGCLLVAIAVTSDPTFPQGMLPGPKGPNIRSVPPKLANATRVPPTACEMKTNGEEQKAVRGSSKPGAGTAMPASDTASRPKLDRLR
jgi:hypothetical protein